MRFFHQIRVIALTLGGVVVVMFLAVLRMDKTSERFIERYGGIE